MIYNVYSIKDTLVGFNAPFIMVSDEVARREFANSLIKNPNKDYLQLWKIGDFDDENGWIGERVGEIIMKGTDLATKEE